jgi:TonB family protein
MMSRTIGQWAIATGLLLAPRARADTPPEEALAPRNVVPPRLSSAPSVSYPSGATGAAVVVLTLTINADGTVRSARATDGEEPFASAAVRTAEAWRFEPAMRDGQPIAATIRFEVSFVPPTETPEPVPVPSGAPSPQPVEAEPSSGAAGIAEPPPAEASSSAPVEVLVRGERLAPAVSSFGRAEIRQLPGAFGDPFRAIEALPGVTPIISGLPFFYIRGAPPGNVGYFLDSIRVPYLFHVGLGPSVIHPAMVERVDLYPGGYPARFGRFSGGIVSGESTAPRTDLHGEGNVRLFDTGAMAETGFARGRGTALLGGRYSYTAALLSLIAPDIALAYHDYQARISYDLTPKDRVSVFSFGSYDLVAQTQNDIQNVLFGSEFYRTDVRYDHSFGSSSKLRTAATLGYDQTRIAGAQRNSRNLMLGLRTELHHPLNDDVLLRAGADAVVDQFSATESAYRDPDDPNTQQINNMFPPRTDTALGARADVVWNATPGIEVTPGMRLDFFRSGDATAWALDPRIAGRFKVVDKLRIVHAYGLAHQPPSFVIPIPGLVPGRLVGGLQQSLQASAGVEIDIPDVMTVTATLFRNAFFNMSDALGTSAGDPDGNGFEQRSQGSGTGFELFLHRRLNKRLGGYLSYTLSRSTRTVGRYTFPSAFDRTHVANAALAYDLGRNWRAGTRLVLYTGVPKMTESSGAISPPPSSSPERDPPFYRVDVRLEKRWPLSRTVWISFIAEVMNVTLSKETFASQQIGPVTIPSIGAEAGF